MYIKEAGKLIGGQVISRVEAKPSADEVCGRIRIMVPKAIKNGTISHADLAEIDLKTPADEKKLTRAGDIVLKLSQPYDAAYISDKDEGILITSFCVLLRGLSETINPKYFVTFVNSQIYKEQAIKMTSGASIPMLTKGKIEDIEFRLPDEAAQEKIASISESIIAKERLFEEIIELEKLKLENILRGEV